MNFYPVDNTKIIIYYLQLFQGRYFYLLFCIWESKDSGRLRNFLKVMQPVMIRDLNPGQSMWCQSRGFSIELCGPSACAYCIDSRKHSLLLLPKSSHSESGERLLETRSGVFSLSQGNFHPPLLPARQWLRTPPLRSGFLTSKIGSLNRSNRIFNRQFCGNSKRQSWFLQDEVSIPRTNTSDLCMNHNQLQMHWDFSMTFFELPPFDFILSDVTPGVPPGSTGISCVLNLPLDYNGIAKSHYSIWKYAAHYFLWITGV